MLFIIWIPKSECISNRDVKKIEDGSDILSITLLYKLLYLLLIICAPLLWMIDCLYQLLAFLHFDVGIALN